MLCGAAHKRCTQQRGHRGGQGGLRASIPSHMTRMFAAALPAQASAYAAEVRPVKLSFGQQRAICLTSEQVLTVIITSISRDLQALANIAMACADERVTVVAVTIITMDRAGLYNGLIIKCVVLCTISKVKVIQNAGAGTEVHAGEEVSLEAESALLLYQKQIVRNSLL